MKQIKDIADLTPDERNPNRGTQRGRSMVESSLRQYGAGRSIVVDADGRVIAGNKTLEAVADIGLAIKVVETNGDELVVVQRRDLDLASDPRARALSVADNRSSEVGLEWDAGVLASIALDDDGVLDGLFSADELQDIVGDLLEAEPAEDPGAQMDKADELRKKWGTARGQLWKIPSASVEGCCHRPLCGDSTDASEVARLMAGKRATVVFTDPPYGVSVGAKNRLLNSVQKAGRCLTDIEDDTLAPDDLKARLLPAFTNIKAVLADDCSVFVCAPQGGELGMMMMMMMREAGLPVRHVLMWKKNAPTFSLGRLDYDYQHEPILFTWVKTHKRVHGGEFRTSVWEVHKPRASKEHPTMKPVELPINAILNHSEHGDAVIDIYCGSGTTIVAAEQTGRLAYGCEIEPKYVAVSLERLSGMGLTPRLAEQS